MSCIVVQTLIVGGSFLSAVPTLASDSPGRLPIALHPANPHYLLFRGQPTVLVSSTEHYGAVLNLDFYYVPYLDELHAKGLNLTRTFSGVYCEDRASFGIRSNTLAPAGGKLLCPWARSQTPGCTNGGNKFDLARWDGAYFRRLKDFLAQAGERGIVVELVLFCPFYDDSMWVLSPMNVRNNVNGLGGIPRTEVYTMKHPEMVALHEALTRKICQELNGFDNLYYEVCNEPYFGGVTGDWQDRIIAAMGAAESNLPKKHLIARNIANGKQKVEGPNPAVSLFNFHYAAPPETVAMNFALNKVIADDETGFRGPGDFTYRAEGWDFLMAGGAIYDNLDYSFTCKTPAGTAVPDAPGGGGAALRSQLRILKNFLQGFDFVHMAPDNRVILGPLPAKVAARALAQRGKQYAVYVCGDGLKNLAIDLPAGHYKYQWYDTRSGPATAATLEHSGGRRLIAAPSYQEDIALGLSTMR
jgi:hypothetical protein